MYLEYAVEKAQSTFLYNIDQPQYRKMCFASLEATKMVLLFHKAVSVHGPSCWSSLQSAKEEDKYRMWISTGG